MSQRKKIELTRLQGIIAVASFSSGVKSQTMLAECKWAPGA